MGEVFYSSMKFKKNLRRGTAATQDEDVTYSEVKIINPTTSTTVRHCGSAGHSGQSSHPYRQAAVCLGLLCALLLAATLVLCVLYTSQSESYSMLERDLEELRTSCNTTKVQQQRKYNEIFKKLPFLEQYCASSSQSGVCEPCPQGWTLFSSKCYYFSNEKKNWTNSRSDCIKRGADLAIIESEEEQRFITNKTKNFTWIGLSYSAIKGNWLWVDGTPLQKGFWKSGEPADKKGFNCTMIVTNINAWAAFYCYNDQYWICETNALLP